MLHCGDRVQPTRQCMLNCRIVLARAGGEPQDNLSMKMDFDCMCLTVRARSAAAVAVVKADETSEGCIYPAMLLKACVSRGKAHSNAAAQFYEFVVDRVNCL